MINFNSVSIKKMIRSKRSVFLVIIIAISVITVSCSTERIIPFSQVGSARPEIIRLKNNTEYRIYSSQISNRVSGDSLIIYNKTAKKTLAVLSEAEIDQIADNKLIRTDSPVNYFFIALSLLFFRF